MLRNFDEDLIIIRKLLSENLCCGNYLSDLILFSLASLLSNFKRTIQIQT